MMTVTRPAIRYYGAKFRLAPWIIAHMPPHICYVEPFAGGMGVLLRKDPSLYDVANDADGEVVNFFRQLREHPDELLRMIELTPYAREEQRLGYEDTEGLSDLERARRLYVRAWQSHGGPRPQWRTGWRYQVSNARNKSVITDWNSTDHLWPIVNRLKLVQFENDDALRVIARFDGPDTLFYCDPPYLQSVRSERWGYHGYMCEVDEDYHRELARALHEIQGMALISGYRSPVYEELFGDWRVVSKGTPTDFNGHCDEYLWISPAADARMRQIRMEFV